MKPPLITHFAQFNVSDAALQRAINGSPANELFYIFPPTLNLEVQCF